MGYRHADAEMDTVKGVFHALTMMRPWGREQRSFMEGLSEISSL